MVGRRLLHYRIVQKIGDGGMGAVYEAEDTHLHRSVAIKVLHAEAATDPDRLHRFLREARSASMLNHPNVVTIHDATETEGLPFIVMECVAGRTLAAIIEEGPIEPALALDYSIQIAAALAAAHAAGIVHRDLKPANVMVTAEGRVKVLDFGIATLTSRAASDATLTLATQPGFIVGTVAYMSPEQAQGMPVDARSDLFSFGAVMYEMVTGHRAFPGESQASVLSAVLRDHPRRPCHLVPRIPRDFEQTILRCLRKDPDERFQRAIEVNAALEQVRPREKPRRRTTSAALAAGVALLTALAGVAWWSLARESTPEPRPLTRLTSDSGFSGYPALSPDGKLLAYASNRSGQENFDLWIKQVPDGEPVRLTNTAADEYDPSFSADGTRIAYRSEQDGGGIYVIPALGGEPRLLVPGGRFPRFSPDGRAIVYRVTQVADSLSGDAFIMPASGGAARRILAGYGIAGPILWSPSGTDLLFWGHFPSPKEHVPLDWWVAPAGGGPAVELGAPQALSARRLQLGPPGVWTESDSIVFTAIAAGAVSLWEIPISPHPWRLSGAPRRLTFGAAGEDSAAASRDGRIAFVSGDYNMDLWSLPINAESGRAEGPMQRLTSDAALDMVPFVSLDGRRIAFLSNRQGGWNAWIKDADTGRERAITTSGDVELYPIISGDGEQVAYPAVEGRRFKLFSLPAGGGTPKVICDGCGQPRSWSPDGRTILSQRPREYMVLMLDVASGTVKVALRHPDAHLYSAQFSADGSWVTFGARFKPGDERLFIVPWQNGAPPQNPTEWIAIPGGRFMDNKPRWSPEGRLLYFTSDRDGFNCVWAQRLNSAKRPVGPAFAVLHLHGPVRSYAAIGGPKLDISVARDKLVFHLEEVRGNVWLLDAPQP